MCYTFHDETSFRDILVGAKSITQEVSSFLVKYEKKMITKIYSVIILLFI